MKRFIDNLNKKQFTYNLFLILIFFLGIFIRTKLYVIKGVFEDDDCRLALAMFDKNLLQMFQPLGPFSSTPIFLFFSKIIANITNYNEYALFIIPLFASILGMFFFFKLSLEYFHKNSSILIANFLFSINFELINFSVVFKHYSTEVLVTILCLYYFPKIDLCNIKFKQCIILSIILAILPLISLPSLFIIGIFIIDNLYKNFRNKMFYKNLAITCIPFCILTTLYYIYNLFPTKAMQYSYYENFWSNVFSVNIINVFASFIHYVYYPNPIIICHLIIIILFIITVCCFKKNRTTFDIYILMFFILIILAHILNLYPIYGRCTLYAVPIFILMCIKTYDSINKNKILLSLISLILISGFICYLMPSYYIAIIKNTDKAFIKYSPKKMLMAIQKDFNPDTDMIIINGASAYCFIFYNQKLNFNTNKFAILKYDENNKIKKENDFKQLNSLNPNKKYWFYLIKEYFDTPERIYIQEWLEKQNIKLMNQEYRSYLYYIIPPYKYVNP